LLQQLESFVEYAKKPTPHSKMMDVNEAVTSIKDKIVDLRSELERHDDKFVRAIEDLKASNYAPGSDYYWVIFVLLYGGVYFLQ
jgi:hypothetical protein